MSGITPDFGTWITNNICACAYPGSTEDLALLTEGGVVHLINLHTRPHTADELKGAGLQELHLPTQDFTPPRLEDLKRGVETIESLERNGKRVAVHCGAGLGRTGTLVACYLVKTGLSAYDAIQQVRRLRPGSIETEEQEDVIFAYEEELRPKS